MILKGKDFNGAKGGRRKETKRSFLRSFNLEGTGVDKRKKGGRDHLMKKEWRFVD